MLQESSQDRNDPNVIAEAGDTWLNGTNAANLNHHRNPRLGSPVECVRQAFVHNRVDFEQDFRFLARFLVSNFAVNPLNQAITNGAGRDQQTVERRTRRVSAELVEQTRQVLGNLAVIGQQTQVLVPASCLGVIVAGTNVAVAMQPIGFLTHHQAQLTVRLETDQAVNHMNPSAFHLASPADIGFLIETRFNLDDGHDLFTGASRVNQGLNNRGIARSTVQGLFDCQNVRILSRLHDELLHRGGERIIRKVYQHIVITNGAENIRGFR